jgi:hypothetical protein
MRALHDSVRASGLGRISCEHLTKVCEPAARPHLMRALHDSVRASGKAAPYASTTNLIIRKKLIKKKKLVNYDKYNSQAFLCIKFT